MSAPKTTQLHDPFDHATLRLWGLTLHGHAVLVFVIVVAVLGLWQYAAIKSRRGRRVSRAAKRRAGARRR
jgi:hypothetical protein